MAAAPCVSRVVRMYLGYCSVGVVVLWSVEFFLGVFEFVYFYGGSVLVEVVDIEDFKLLHEGGCMCSGWYVAYQPNKFLLKCSEWLDVHFAAVCGAPQ